MGALGLELMDIGLLWLITNVSSYQVIPSRHHTEPLHVQHPLRHDMLGT